MMYRLAGMIMATPVDWGAEMGGGTSPRDPLPRSGRIRSVANGNEFQRLYRHCALEAVREARRGRVPIGEFGWRVRIRYRNWTELPRLYLGYPPVNGDWNGRGR